ncbi:hypothetical protein BpHYR1_018323 [Brachionus plicatilis]|uniref:Uncharacterized protein n=1 Tax=Brachionus plicatilis TaxID=10195 RepID=A0A3M7PJ41_BRAPC|nr:hypothetical protein BpHYR1_018323 [Brachionus plicatilis]
MSSLLKSTEQKEREHLSLRAVHYESWYDFLTFNYNHEMVDKQFVNQSFISFISWSTESIVSCLLTHNVNKLLFELRMEFKKKFYEFQAPLEMFRVRTKTITTHPKVKLYSRLYFIMNNWKDFLSKMVLRFTWLANIRKIFYEKNLYFFFVFRLLMALNQSAVCLII